MRTSTRPILRASTHIDRGRACGRASQPLGIDKYVVASPGAGPGAAFRAAAPRSNARRAGRVRRREEVSGIDADSAGRSAAGNAARAGRTTEPYRLPGSGSVSPEARVTRFHL